MNTKIIMAVSGICLAFAGIALTFLPNEIAACLGLTSGLPVQLILQIAGALYFGFGILNWMAKGMVTGGIYNRPIVMANLSQFVIGGLALIKGLMDNTGLPKTFWILTIAYIIFGILFSVMLFSDPAGKKKA